MKGLVQYINEISDDLLKRAIDKSKEQNTALSRRRAREFEKYLEDPDRQKRNMLSEKNPYQRKIIQLIEKYLQPTYEFFNNKKRNDANNEAMNFVYYLGDYVDDEMKKISTRNIKFYVDLDSEFSGRYMMLGKGYDCEKGYAIKISPKRNIRKFYEKPIGFTVAVKLVGEKSSKLEKLGYDRTTIYIPCLFNFYRDPNEQKDKNGEYDFSWGINFSEWSLKKSIPPEYEKDFKNGITLLKTILNDNQESVDEIWNYAKGEKSLDAEITGYDILRANWNREFRGWGQLSANVGFGRVLEIVKDILKEVDSDCSYKIIKDNKKSKESNYYIGNARQSNSEYEGEAEFTYKGKTYTFLYTGRTSWGGKDNYVITCNDKVLFSSYTEDSYGSYYDAGWSLNDEAKDIFK